MLSTSAQAATAIECSQATADLPIPQPCHWRPPPGKRLTLAVVQERRLVSIQAASFANHIATAYDCCVQIVLFDPVCRQLWPINLITCREQISSMCLFALPLLQAAKRDDLQSQVINSSCVSYPHAVGMLLDICN